MGTVSALPGGKHRVPLPLQEADVLVAPDADIEVPVLRGLLEEPHVSRVKPVVATGDNHLFTVV